MSGTDLLALVHVHSVDSNGDASELNEVVQRAMRVAGGANHGLRWRECFTRFSQFEAAQRGRHVRQAADLVFVTDHMNDRSHHYSEQALRWAAGDRRRVLGAEIKTGVVDADGFKRGPEVLLLGETQLVQSPFGPYVGMSQSTIDEIFETCCLRGRSVPDTLKVAAFCDEHDIACALAHPFDGHHLRLEAVLELMAAFKFVETLNGGALQPANWMAQRYVAFHNRAVQGGERAFDGKPLTELKRELAGELDGGRPILCWGGSDAHAPRFDRVVVRYRTSNPSATALDLIRDMAWADPWELLASRRIIISGASASWPSLLGTITRINVRNLAYNAKLMVNPVLLVRTVQGCARTVRAEMRWRSASSRRLQREFCSRFEGLTTDDAEYGWQRRLSPLVQEYST